jgi:CRISPR-associated endonuclease/helicase Cas3
MCWAKTTTDERPGISVCDHCLNVGCIAEALVDLLPPPLQTLLPQGVVTLAALHDIGKVSPGFQAKCPAWVARYNLPPQFGAGCETDHAKVGQYALQTLLGDSLRFWAAVVGAHHGKIKGDRVGPPTETNSAHWSEERNLLIGELVAVFGPLPAVPGNTAAYWFTAGLITVADWIGSDEEKFTQGWSGSIEARRRLATQAIRTLDWKLPTAKHGLQFGELFPSYSANALQVAAWNNITAPGLYVIEGPMGWGKTEAALAAAYRLIEGGHASGIYFALPTQVTSNRIHLRVRPFLDNAVEGGAEARLMHSASWLVQPPPLEQLHASDRRDAEAQEHVRAGRSWFASAKRAILAPFGVGTVDQALLGIVAAKHFFVRQFGLAGKVVILDEVHTYDLYTSTLIDTLIRRLRELKCTVIVLSATLTRDRRRELLQLAGGEAGELSADYPLVSCGSSPVQEFSVSPPPPKSVAVRFPAAESLVESALERARQGQCVLWIRNTVDEAQQTFGRLKSANHEGGPTIALLHSRFPQFRREELESDWMARLDKTGEHRPKNGCVLVSTQVVEQSVDIDADLLISDLAPTDMLLQRMGRLHRHDRPNRPGTGPEIWIPTLNLPANGSAKALREALGKSAHVYAPYVLLRSWQLWRDRQTITLPDDIREILEATYAPPSANESPAWAELRADLERRKTELSAKALNATNVWAQPALNDAEGVQTRYNTYPTASLLVARKIEPVNSLTVSLELLNGDTVTASGRDWNIETARAIHRNLVRMPLWAVVDGLANAPDWLRLHVAESAAIGLLQTDGTLQFPGSDTLTGLSYCAERGILIAPRSRATTTRQETSHDEDESYD